MVVQDLIKNISERIQSTASVKAVYGDPITAEGKTIIPVARVLRTAVAAEWRYHR